MKSHRLPPEVAKSLRLALDLHKSGRADAVEADAVSAAKYIAQSGHASEMHLREWCAWFADHSSQEEMEFRRDQQRWIAALIVNGEECGDVSESVEWLLRGGFHGRAWARRIMGEPQTPADVSAASNLSRWE